MPSRWKRHNHSVLERLDCAQSNPGLPLLRRVLRSTFVTHRQLYDFMRLEYCTWSRHSFNNRVLRLVKHNYLVRDEVPFKTDGYVYSISEMGASEAIGLGECYTGATQRPKDGKLPKAVYHAIDLNEIHLALKRSGLLIEWTSDTELRSRNELGERRPQQGLRRSGDREGEWKRAEICAGIRTYTENPERLPAYQLRD